MPTLFDPAHLAAYTQSVQPTPPAAPAPHDEAMWPYLALFGGQGADAVTTLAALSRGARETNPMGAAGTLASKVAATAFLAWLMHKEHEKGNDKAQKLVGTLGGLLGAGPAVWNLSQMAK